MTALPAEDAAKTHAPLLGAKALVPEHVAFRAFAQETIMLNLKTGRYHGLDPIGGRLLELLPRADSVRDAARQLAEEFSRPAAEVEQDVLEFCLALQERGLLVLHPNGNH